MKEAGPAGRLERLYREHGDRLWRAVLGYAGDRQVADDAVLEAFTQALARGDELRDPLAWIWRVAFRVAAGELKERRRTMGKLVETAYQLPEPADELAGALARLSPKQRAAVLLHHFAGFPTREVAAILDSSPSAIRVHLSVGRRRLRALLEEEEHDEQT